MKLIQNNKGVTLIEVLIAIVILSIILVSIMNIFPQMGLTNKINGDKSQAINTAKEMLIEWENAEGIQNYFAGDPTQMPAPVDHNDVNYNYFVTTSGNYTVDIKIAKNPPQNFPAGPSQIRFIQVQLLNKQNTVVSETYGYLSQ